LVPRAIDLTVAGNCQSCLHISIAIGYHLRPAVEQCERAFTIADLSQEDDMHRPCGVLLYWRIGPYCIWHDDDGGTGGNVPQPIGPSATQRDDGIGSLQCRTNK
jgi:hypothetical protein